MEGKEKTIPGKDDEGFTVVWTLGSCYVVESSGVGKINASRKRCAKSLMEGGEGPSQGVPGAESSYQPGTSWYLMKVPTL